MTDAKQSRITVFKQFYDFIFYGNAADITSIIGFITGTIIFYVSIHAAQPKDNNIILGFISIFVLVVIDKIGSVIQRQQDNNNTKKFLDGLERQSFETYEEIRNSFDCRYLGRPDEAIIHVMNRLQFAINCWNTAIFYNMGKMYDCSENDTFIDTSITKFLDKDSSRIVDIIGKHSPLYVEKLRTNLVSWPHAKYQCKVLKIDFPSINFIII